MIARAKARVAKAKASQRLRRRKMMCGGTIPSTAGKEGLWQGTLPAS
jgi:hypothetical protein